MGMDSGVDGGVRGRGIEIAPWIQQRSPKNGYHDFVLSLKIGWIRAIWNFPGTVIKYEDLSITVIITAIIKLLQYSDVAKRGKGCGRERGGGWEFSNS